MLTGLVVEEVFGSELAVAATYNGNPVRIVRRHAMAEFSLDGAPISAASTIVRVRRTDVPNPAEGDQIGFDGFTYLVVGAPRLSGNGLIWDLAVVANGPDPLSLSPWEEAS